MNDETTIQPSDEQRLHALERGQRLNRILLIALSGVLLMTLASWGTWGLFSLFATEPEDLTAKHMAALQQRVDNTQQHAQNLDTQVEQLRALIAAQASNTPTQAPAPVDPSAEILHQVATVMNAQEQSFQHSLGALKTGMRDLAGMIAGSRSWLADYNEALDKALQESQERQKRLQQWTGPDKAASRS